MKIDSTNKKVLILPDIHTKIKKATKIINHEAADIIVSVGDLFDDYDDTEEQNMKTATWYKTMLRLPNFHSVWGNHDLPYGKESRRDTCSGFTYDKCIAINNVMEKQDWDKVAFFHTVDDYLITHAGCHSHFIPSYCDTLDKAVEMLEAENKLANTVLEKGIDASGKKPSHWFWQCGMARGGHKPFGGLIWCDATEEFIPHETIKQIFGHTYARNPRQWRGENNICFDCNMRNWITITNKKLELKHWYHEF